ncbi:hypothetical protein HZC21_04530 [Candidatus Peregrinibacteria bacterium]|nr:hypothetical protein [Candidatus Peregrinibacteria bacterium]
MEKGKDNPQEEVKPRHGNPFTVDISNETCERFGFHHGDQILVKGLNKQGVVVGVAPHIPSSPDGIDALWVRLEGEDTVCFFPNPTEDFEPKNSIDGSRASVAQAVTAARSQESLKGDVHVDIVRWV